MRNVLRLLLVITCLVLGLPATTLVHAQSSSWTYEFFAGRNLQGAPILSGDISFIDYYWADQSPHADLKKDDYSARWTKTTTIPAGDYVLSVGANDGVRLYVDGGLVIDEWRDQKFSIHTVTIPLSAGTHSFKLEYYDGPNVGVISFGDVEGTAVGGQFAGGPVLVRVVDQLRLRKGPGLRYDWTDIVPWGTIASVTKRYAFARGNWIYIEYGNKKGWVYIYFVRVVHGSMRNVPLTEEP